MNRSEAIKILKEANVIDLASGDTKGRQAVDLAIKALQEPKVSEEFISRAKGLRQRIDAAIDDFEAKIKQETGIALGSLTDWSETMDAPPVEPVAKNTTTTDCISRRDALKPFCITPDGTRIPEVDCDNFPVEFSVKDIKRHLLSLPPVAPKPVCDDCISRETVMEAISNCEHICDVYGELKTLIENIPSVEPTNKAICEHFYKGYCSRFEDGCFWQCQKEPERPKNTDCISRKQAIEALTGWQTEPLDEDIVRELNALPPVTPTERTGEWIGNHSGYWKCSECGLRVLVVAKGNYCPNCGAKMGGDTE